MNGVRLARNVSAGAVAGIAAWSSWSHMVHVALRFGERPEVALVMPLSVDGMLVVATTAMVDDRRHGRPVRFSARLAFTVGVVASIAANVVGAHPSIGARIVAGWPALALLLVVEMLSRSGRTDAEVGRVAAAVPVELDGRQVEQPSTEDDLTAAARTVASELTAAGRKVSRDALASALRARGHRVGTDRAAALARAVTVSG